MQVQPYLCFEGRCEEAIEFYRKALGAEVTSIMRFSEAPGGACGGGCAVADPQKIMHATLKIGQTEIMASDGMCSAPAEFKGIALSLSVDTDEQAQARVASLSEGGQVTMPLQKTFFASSFAMVKDPFGVSWSIFAPVPVHA